MLAPDTQLHHMMTISHFRLICRHFGDTPARLAAILDGTAVTVAMLDGSAQTVTLAQQVRQIENMNAHFGIDWFLDAPAQLHFSAHGPTGVAGVAAPTLADTIAVLCSFVSVRLPVLDVLLHRGPDRSQLELRLIADVPVDVARPIILITLIAIRSLIATILVQPRPGAAFAFAGPDRGYGARLAAVLDAPVAFDAGANVMSFPSAWLDTRSPFADPAQYAGAIATLNALASAREKLPRGLRHQVEQLLAEHPGGRLDADACARRLGLSRRTLTRRLADEGTSFRLLLDRDLHTRATALIEAGALSTTRIADQLGYHNPSSFRRALQRWSRVDA
jgi:AraC-like DNA-binding protein